MERPLCPLCNVRHFAREPHEFKTEMGIGVQKGEGAKTGGGARAVAAKSHNEDTTGVNGVGSPLGSRRLPGRPRVFADAKSRRREYMREWRGRKKGIVIERPIPPCVVCGRPAKNRSCKFCEECQTGAKPSSVESAVARAIRNGELKSVHECVCVDCGAPARHYDHRDYNKPLEVDPVCAKCNMRRGHAIPYGRDAKGNWVDHDHEAYIKEHIAARRAK